MTPPRGRGGPSRSEMVASCQQHYIRWSEAGDMSLDGLKLRCAVIGSGFAGTTFAEAIRYVPEAELVAIAGGHQAPDVAARHGVRALATADVDAVLITSPNPFHAPQAIRAANAGKHIFVEKPMGMNVAECRAMIDAAN